MTWAYAVNDADIQQLAEGEEVLQTYRVIIRDAAGEEDSQLVTIRLQGSNDEPIAAAVALEVDAHAEAGVQVAQAIPPLQAAFVADDVDSDDDQGTLTYELLGQPSGGTVTNNNDGTFSFDPGHDFDDLAEGETRDVTVTYRAVDSHGAVSNEAVITITVRGVGSSTPQPPVVEDQSFAVAEESVAGAAVGTVLATDADSTALSYAIGNGESRAVALGDLNGDGTIDAFVANSGTAGGNPDNNGTANEVWFNDGNGNFTLSTITACPSATAPVSTSNSPISTATATSTLSSPTMSTASRT